MSIKFVYTCVNNTEWNLKNLGIFECFESAMDYLVKGRQSPPMYNKSGYASFVIRKHQLNCADTGILVFRIDWLERRGGVWEIQKLPFWACSCLMESGLEELKYIAAPSMNEAKRRAKSKYDCEVVSVTKIST